MLPDEPKNYPVVHSLSGSSHKKTIYSNYKMEINLLIRAALSCEFRPREVHRFITELYCVHMIFILGITNQVRVKVTRKWSPFYSSPDLMLMYCPFQQFIVFPQ